MGTPEVAALGVAGIGHDRVEVRVLGPLRVRRVDGALVNPHDWRTGKTADLLRLLALHVDNPVPVDLLLDALWPAVGEARARASLRTAASRIRKVLGANCVERRLGGLVLHDAWVDAHAFRTLAREARRHMVTGAAARVVTTTREAEPLYLAESGWHTGNADWAVRELDALAATYRQLIADAADAAVSLSWWHDAMDFAERSILLDPCSERGYRALMRGYRGVGETSRALQAYQRCRRVLAEELGADPSTETQELHVQLLTEDRAELPVPAFCGRAHELQWVQEFAEGARTGQGPSVVCLFGASGSGKTRFLQEAWHDGAQTVSRVWASVPTPGAALARVLGVEGNDPSDGPDSALDGGVPVVAVLDDAHLLTPEAVQAVVGTLRRLPQQATVVVAGRPALDGGPMEQIVESLGEGFDGRAGLLQLPSLAEEEVAELCVRLLHGEVSAELTKAVLEETGGAPGAVISLIRRWAGSGRVAATTDGLVVVGADRSSQLGGPVRHLLAEAVDHLSGEDLDVLHLVAVLGQPVSPDALLPLTSDLLGAEAADAQRHRLQQTLDHLVDRSLLTAGDSGFTIRDPLLRDALVAWLRPSTLRRLQRRIAERARIPASQRIAHWSAAGEPQLAKAASLEASADAMSEGRYDHARDHLRQLSRLTAAPDAVPSDRLEVFERLGDVCGALGHPQEALAALAVASDVARVHRLQDLERIDAKLRGVADGTVICDTRTEPAPRSLGHAGPLGPSLGIGRDTYPDPGAEQRLSAAVWDADQGTDPDRRAELRSLLASTVCIPRRQFRAAHRWTMEALSLTVDPSLCARALLAGWLPAAVLGNGPAVEDRLSHAAKLAAKGGDNETATHIAALRCLVAHDLGRPSYHELCARATDAGAFDDGADDLWILVRVATERGDLGTAESADRSPLSHSAPPVLRQLHDITSAALAMELGRPEQARERLLEVIDVADETGSTLLVPEAAARLVILEATVDAASARERFELFDWAVGGNSWLPRENVLRLLARAAIRAADGRPDHAAAAAGSAADAAESIGLPLLAGESHRHRAIHLFAAGRRTESRLAAVAADRSYQSAGATAFLHRGETDFRRVRTLPVPAGGGSQPPPPGLLPVVPGQHLGRVVPSVIDLQGAEEAVSP